MQVKQPECLSGTEETNYMRNFPVLKSELTTLKQVKFFHYLTILQSRQQHIEHDREGGDELESLRHPENCPALGVSRALRIQQ